MALIRRTRIRNTRPVPTVIFIELECWDYWMMPDEEFEIRAEISSPDAEFEFALHEDGISVYPTHNMGDITVHKGDVQLDWSHQRPKGWPTAQT